MRAQFRDVDKQDIVDMYIYIHACALNRKNVTEQRMNTYISAYFSFKGQYINEYPYGMRDSGLKHKKNICLPCFEPTPNQNN